MTPAEQTATTARTKPSLFNRIIGVLGELLITAGIVIALFIVWQIWWTDIEANRAQANEIEQLQQEYGVVTVEDSGIAPRQEGPPPEWSGEPAYGDTLGIMRIPAFGYDYGYTIRNGTNMTEILNTGAFGRYEDTALPGEVGNFATAAHRQTYGAPMIDVPDLEEGDAIVVETSDVYLVYSIVSDQIVLPTEVWTIAPDPFQAYEQSQGRGELTAPTRRLLTITTCHPPFVSNERWVVHAEFDYWTKREDGLPEALVDPETADALEGGN